MMKSAVHVTVSGRFMMLRGVVMINVLLPRQRVDCGNLWTIWQRLHLVTMDGVSYLTIHKYIGLHTSVRHQSIVIQNIYLFTAI